MKDVFGIFNRMKDMYQRYMDSPYAIGHEKLSLERKSLLEKEGVIYQYPYIEAMPAFKTSGKNLAQACETLDLPPEFATFASKGLFPGTHLLHQHQYEALEKVICQKKNIVVTSGTGSGKTESFLLPLIASIINESIKWEKSDRKEEAWWAGGKKWTPQRQHENRQSAVRGLVLYPLNALVEDQLVRLRKALDSDEAREWFDTNLNGNRIHFGRYTGKTPLAGDIDSTSTSRLKNILENMASNERNQRTRFSKLKSELSTGKLSFHGRQQIQMELHGELDLDLYSDDINDDEATFISNRLDQKMHEKLSFLSKSEGGEMVSRWDMQFSPPDIFITNFSMLNILLTRQIEQNMLHKTKEWLERDSSHTFFLVVDELHSYRGTAGTEVSYILRSLLDRLGLTPDSPQLRIIATSASLDETGMNFLEDFFGAPMENFEILSGARESADSFWTSDDYKELESSFSSFFKLANAGVTDNRQLIDAFIKDSGCEADKGDPYGSLYRILNNSGAIYALLNQCKQPKSIKDLSKELFDQNQDLTAIGGLIHALILSRDNGSVPLPIRAHLFFRNFPGLWACSNPNCGAVDEAFKYEGRTIGKLYTQPQIQCTCGSRVLDLYYCQNCGDVFLGGFKAKEHFGVDAFFLSADFPNLESLPDKLPSSKRFGEYALFWPSLDIDADVKPWTRTVKEGNSGSKKLYFAWKKSHYDPHLGKIKLDSIDSPNGYWYQISGDNEEAYAMPAFPIICPHCADDWESKAKNTNEPLQSTKRSRSPIRGQRTGFDMIAQVMLDSLLREMVDEEQPKVVLFSDSRQDAAKLSAKIELNHYYHLLRTVVVRVIYEQKKSARAFIRQLNGQSLPDEDTLAEEFWNQHWEQASLLEAYFGGRALPPNKRLEVEKLIKDLTNPAKLGQLWDEIELRLIKLGINPGGPLNSVQTHFDTMEWIQLYNWSDNRNPIPKTDLSVDETEFRRHIMRELRDNVLANVLFSQRKRDLESLSLGTIKLDVDLMDEGELGKDPAFWRQLIDSSCRILGGLRRYDENRMSSDAAPGRLRGYWEAIARQHGISENQFVTVSERIFSGLKGVKGYLIQSDEIYIVQPTQDRYECTKCHRVHLHPSCGICTDCYSPLQLSSDMSEEVDDYYKYLAEDDGTLRRLHSEELTGQTDDEQAIKRQQMFQAIFGDSDIPLVDEIDVLSVTTTMEAGVDIGSLRVVAMSNMPPQRFNYQQRVGRTGRRGSALSASLTMCRGRSHDDWYFDNLDKMTGDPPPQPYIDLSSSKIFRRVLNKEMLFYAFVDSGLSQEGVGGESVHGAFGLRSEWNAHKSRIQSYLSSADGSERASEVIRALAVKTKLASEQLVQMLKYVTEGGLVRDVTLVADDPAYSQNALSENLAAAGLLPMFGFPTRVRQFHHARRSDRTSAFRLQHNVVDRDLELAINEYSPGSEIIKDKVKHRAVGLAHYWIRGNKVVAESDPLGNIMTVGMCNSCQMLYTGNEVPDVCTSCGSVRDADESGYKSIRLTEPQGFRSEWKKRDFKEEFEWSSRSSVPRLAHNANDSDSMEYAVSERNMSYLVREGNVYSINDNNGRMFTFTKAVDDYEGWIDVDRIGIDGFKPAVTGRTETVALASIKNTEVLIVGPEQIATGLTFDTRELGVRAGLISFGFLFRRVATNILDVDADELQVGLRPILKDPVTKTLVGQIFFADRLINGAGYAKHLAQDNILKGILSDLLGECDYVPKLRNHQCDSSCYECLRTYENMGYHGILDWRLALDVAKVLSDNSHIPAIDGKWNSLVCHALENIERGYEGSVARWYSGVPAISFPENEITLLFGHPLWDRREDFLNEYFANATADAEAEMPNGMVLRYNTFDLIRRPAWVLRDVWERVNPWGQ